MKKVIITINPKTNERSIQIEGVSGPSCTELTDILTAGTNVTESRLTAEYAHAQELPDYETVE